jgi:hypothetical protein
MGAEKLFCIRSRPLGSPWRAAYGVASPPNAFGVGFDIGDPGRGWESSLTSEEGVRDGENATGWLEGEPVARVDCVDEE